MEAGLVIEHAKIFTGLGENSLAALSQASRFRKVGKGEFIFLQEDVSAEAYLVCSGKISILLESGDGRKLVINEMHAGDFFGEIGLLAGQTRSTSAVARSDSLLLVIPSRVFLQVLDNEPNLVRRLLDLTMLRLRESSARESALAFLDAQGRLARLLLYLGARELEKGYVTISQEELAERTGQTRQTVAKALSRWRRLGWLITGRGRIMLLDLNALSRLEINEPE